jgi:hypothetical protein
MANKHSKNTISAYDEDKWRAESDCHTLIEAEVIRADPKRFKAAQQAAKRKVEEMTEKTQAMNKLAGKK